MLHGKKSDSAYLLDLAKRIMHIPVAHGVDQFDTDCLADLAKRLSSVDRSITMPTTADEAEMMEKIGFAWLKKNAPERLTPEGMARSIPTPSPQELLVGSIPSGYALVPIKPTDEMLDAALGVHESRDGDDEEFFAEFRRTYRAMVTAAPSTPSPVERDEP